MKRLPKLLKKSILLETPNIKKIITSLLIMKSSLLNLKSLKLFTLELMLWSPSQFQTTERLSIKEPIQIKKNLLRKIRLSKNLVSQIFAFIKTLYSKLISCDLQKFQCVKKLLKENYHKDKVQ